MSGMTDSLPTNLSFGQIEEFDINEWDATRFSEIFSVVLNNKHSLKKLRLNFWLNDTEIFELANADLRLVEMNLKFQDEISLGTLEKLLENPHLNRLELKAYGYTVPYRIYIKLDIFSNDWNITRSTTVLLFERRLNLTATN